MLADLVARRLRLFRDQILRRHQHARRAEAALQRVALMERALQLRNFAGVGQAFDGIDAFAGGLHREHQAAAHDVAVDAHGACAAHAVLAAGVRAGEAQVFTQEVDQVLARLDAPRRTHAIDEKRGFDCVIHDGPVRAHASSAASARPVMTRARCSFVAAVE